MTEPSRPTKADVVRAALAKSLGQVLYRTERDGKAMVAIAVGGPPEPSTTNLLLPAEEGRAGIVRGLRTLAAMFRGGDFDTYFAQADLALLGAFVSLSDRRELEGWVVTQLESDRHSDTDRTRIVFEPIVAVSPRAIEKARRKVMINLGLTDDDIERTRQEMRRWLVRPTLRRVEDDEGWGTEIEPFDGLTSVDPPTSRSISVVDAVYSALCAEALTLAGSTETWPGRNVSGRTVALAVFVLLSTEDELLAWIVAELDG